MGGLTVILPVGAPQSALVETAVATIPGPTGTITVITLEVHDALFVTVMVCEPGATPVKVKGEGVV